MTWLLSIGLHNAVVTAFLVLLVWGITRVWKNAPAAHLLWYPLWPPPIPRLDRAPLSQEYFSVPDNYLGPKSL